MTHPASSQSKPLSSLQLELLKLYSTEVTPEELLDIKRLLAGYFGRKAVQSADRVWSDRGLTDDDMDEWLRE